MTGYVVHAYVPAHHWRPTDPEPRIDESPRQGPRAFPQAIQKAGQNVESGISEALEKMFHW